MFQGLTGAQVFSKIELTNAFLQVPLHDDSKEMTNIHTNWGLYPYQFLPFGLTTSRDFQKVIDEVITNLPGVRSYQDDIIVHATSLKEHDGRLLQLLKVLDKHNVRINKKNRS